MRFLWFGKKKVSTAPTAEVEVTREPQEVYSIVGYQCLTAPLAGTKALKNLELSRQAINSLILTLVSQEHSPAYIAAQEFFQEQGANHLPIRDYSFSAERGLSGRVQDDEVTRTVLIGPAKVIARATTPFHDAIAEAVLASLEISVVAIDGIAYATYSINCELI